MSIDPIYETEDIFCSKAVWDFSYRFQSMHRHWVLSKEHFKDHIDELKLAKTKSANELLDIYSETAGIDADFFPEYIRLSTITVALSLFENMLVGLSKEVAEDLGIETRLTEKNIPYINKYILWFTKGCGIDVDIDKSHWKYLDAIRNMSNRFIHQIDRDIPENIRKVISEMINKSLEDAHGITDEFVDISLIKIAELAKTIELAHIHYYQNHLKIEQ